MSTETRSGSKRRYRKRRRAELEDETRQRIAAATAELHGSVGPARTTVSAVAERAGVQRATVYRHFPDEEALFEACSTHWFERHPLPELESWAEIRDPDARLRTALDELYGWFERGEYMIEKIIRDRDLVPGMEPSVALFEHWFELAGEALLRGRPQRGPGRRRARAAIGHSVSFATWRSLVREQGLDRAAAIELMAALVAAAPKARAPVR